MILRRAAKASLRLCVRWRSRTLASTRCVCRSSGDVVADDEPSAVCNRPSSSLGRCIRRWILPALLPPLPLSDESESSEWSERRFRLPWCGSCCCCCCCCCCCWCWCWCKWWCCWRCWRLAPPRWPAISHSPLLIDCIESSVDRLQRAMKLEEIGLLMARIKFFYLELWKTLILWSTFVDEVAGQFLRHFSSHEYRWKWEGTLSRKCINKAEITNWNIFLGNVSFFLCFCSFFFLFKSD